MFFTIIIPTRNRPKELEVCLSHILLQTYRDYEVLIIDDGSQTEIVQQYSNIIPEDKRFKLINQEAPTITGMGVSVVRNIGIEKAAGEYIAFCDDDDFWTDSNHLAIAHNTIIENNIDMFFANQNAIRSNGSVSYSNWFPHLSKNTNKYETISKTNNTFLLTLSQLLKETEIPSLNTLILKKDICTKIKGFWSRLTNLEDRDFYFRALEECNNICFRKDVVCQHNIPDSKIIKSISNSIVDADQHILMIAVLNHIIVNTNRKEIVHFCKQFLGWKYRDLALLTKNKSQLLFAEKALISSFSIKWFIFTLYLNLKQMTKNLLNRN